MSPQQFIDAAGNVARVTGWNIDGYAAERGWKAVGLGPVGHHRDSDVLDESNWAVVSADLQRRFPGDVELLGFGHWGVGWVEELAFNAGCAEVVTAVTDWANRLAEYPVADDDDFAAREYEHAIETLRGGGWGDAECWQDELPEDWAEQLYSALSDDCTRGDHYREARVLEAAAELGFYSCA